MNKIQNLDNFNYTKTSFIRVLYIIIYYIIKYIIKNVVFY